MTKSWCLCDSVSGDKLPALRKSLVWLIINLSGDTQKSLVPCRKTTTCYNPASTTKRSAALFLFQRLITVQFPAVQMHKTDFTMGSYWQHKLFVLQHWYHLERKSLCEMKAFEQMPGNIHTFAQHTVQMTSTELRVQGPIMHNNNNFFGDQEIRVKTFHIIYSQQSPFSCWSQSKAVFLHFFQYSSKDLTVTKPASNNLWIEKKTWCNKVKHAEIQLKSKSRYKSLTYPLFFFYLDSHLFHLNFTLPSYYLWSWTHVFSTAALLAFILLKTWGHLIYASSHQVWIHLWAFSRTPTSTTLFVHPPVFE